MKDIITTVYHAYLFFFYIAQQLFVFSILGFIFYLHLMYVGAFCHLLNERILYCIACQFVHVGSCSTIARWLAGKTHPWNYCDWLCVEWHVMPMTHTHQKPVPKTGTSLFSGTSFSYQMKLEAKFLINISTLLSHQFILHFKTIEQTSGHITPEHSIQYI